MKEEALKLADLLEGAEYPSDTVTFDSANMIRKLVAELDKKEKSDTSLHLVPLPEVDRSLLDSNESISQPVAYMETDTLLRWLTPVYPPKGTQLYTSPQTKPLSDEEILKEWYSTANVRPPSQRTIDFAKAIEERILGK